MEDDQARIFLIMAEEIAREAHDGQFRRDGVTPYIEHVETVVDGVRGHTEAMIVAWLHDVVEDTGITFDDLVDAGFSESILDAVEALTHDVSIPYSVYVRSLLDNALAAQVKIADVRANLSDDPTPQQVIKYQSALRILTGNTSSTV